MTAEKKIAQKRLTLLQVARKSVTYPKHAAWGQVSLSGNLRLGGISVCRTTVLLYDAAEKIVFSQLPAKTANNRKMGSGTR